MATPRTPRPPRGASVHPRLRADGTTAYRLMYRLDGAQKVVTFDDPDDAAQWQARFARDPKVALALLTATQAQAAGQVDDVLTVDRMVAQHIAGLSGIEPRTIADYERDARLHISPSLGAMPAVALADREVTAAWVRTLEETLAPKTIANVHALLSAACATAVDAGRLPSNPVRGLRLPRGIPEEMVFLTQQQVAELLSEIPEHWRPLVATLVGSGVRWGEAAALTVADVDLDAGTLRVIKAIGRDPRSRAHVKTTKTRRGVRTVRVPKVVVDQLRPLVVGRSATDPLFTTRKMGRRVAHNNFHGRVWKPALARLAVPVLDEDGQVLRRAWEVEPRIHDLRHTYASWALQSGVPLIELQRQMGHESITTTADRYGHLAPGAGAATAAAIGSRLSAALRGAGHLRLVEDDQPREVETETGS